MKKGARLPEVALPSFLVDLSRIDDDHRQHKEDFVFVPDAPTKEELSDILLHISKKHWGKHILGVAMRGQKPQDGALSAWLCFNLYKARLSVGDPQFADYNLQVFGIPDLLTGMPQRVCYYKGRLHYIDDAETLIPFYGSVRDFKKGYDILNP